jgi:hypothetical protein
MADCMAKLDSDGKIHARALERFTEIASATMGQRADSLTARRFSSIPGAQWEGDWAAQFDNTIRVEVNKTARGVDKIITYYRSNRITVEFRAVGGKSSEQTAETLGGLHRADAYHYKSQQARDNAFEEAASGGFGAYRLCTDYADARDPDDDSLRINPGKAIVDADQRVFFDLDSKLYDKSDADHAFVLSSFTTAGFERAYEGAASTWPESLLRMNYEWFRPSIVLVAEYYETEELSDTRQIWIMPVSGETQNWWQSDLDADDLAKLRDTGWKIKSEKARKRQRIHKYTMSGLEVLSDDGFISGDMIPIVPVYGKRWFIENMERWRGHVQLAMDPQRIYNAQISKLVETSSLSPRQVPIFHPEQTAGHEADWARANIARLPYLRINPMTGSDGNPIPGGPVGYLAPPQLGPVDAAIIQLTANDIQELTSADDSTDTVQSNVSAQAMDIAATRIDANFGTYMDNMRQSVQREGEIYQAMSVDTYFEPGRVLDTMGDDGSDDEATLHEGVTDAQGNYSIRNDLARGRYKVISDVTEATATRRDKTVRAMLNVAQVATAAQNMDLSSAALFTALLNMDGEGVNEIQDWARTKALAIGLVKPTDEEKQAMETAQQNQQPDPNAQLAQSQSLALMAVAKKDSAMSDKLVADTALSKAKTLQTLTDAHDTNTRLGHAAFETFQKLTQAPPAAPQQQ